MEDSLLTGRFCSWQKQKKLKKKVNGWITTTYLFVELLGQQTNKTTSSLFEWMHTLKIDCDRTAETRMKQNHRTKWKFPISNGKKRNYQNQCDSNGRVLCCQIVQQTVIDVLFVMQKSSKELPPPNCNRPIGIWNILNNSLADACQELKNNIASNNSLIIYSLFWWVENNLWEKKNLWLINY